MGAQFGQASSLADYIRASLATLVTLVTLVVAVPADAAGSTCRGAFPLPHGRVSDSSHLSVEVHSRRGMSCSTALRLGSAAYPLPHLKPIYGPQFGGGGFGGPFKVGRFSCYLSSRGSDFINAKCQTATQAAQFYDHRELWAVVFYPFSGIATHSTPKRGYCWTGSLTADRSDAWRCLVGNTIYDPCFSSTDFPGRVMCPNAALSGNTEISLTRGLPESNGNTRDPSTGGLPWDIQLDNGQHCVLASGASNIVQGKRLNYFCGRAAKYGLWGAPLRTTEPWSILVAPYTATRLRVRRPIRLLWY